MTSFLNYVQSDKKINPLILSELTRINANYTRTKNHSVYSQEIAKLFDLNPLTQLTNVEKVFLAGFIEGEGSLNVGAKKTFSATFGLCIDPEFSITQSIFGVNQLYKALVFFKTGRISYKSGSNATLVFRIDNRQNLDDVVIPFYQKFVRPFSADKKVERLDRFIELLDAFNNNEHSNYNQLMTHVLPLWDEMRMQKGQVNQTFADLSEARAYVIAVARQKGII